MLSQAGAARRFAVRFLLPGDKICLPFICVQNSRHKRSPFTVGALLHTVADTHPDKILPAGAKFLCRECGRLFAAFLPRDSFPCRSGAGAAFFCVTGDSALHGNLHMQRLSALHKTAVVNHLPKSGIFRNLQPIGLLYHILPVADQHPAKPGQPVQSHGMLQIFHSDFFRS